MNYINYKRTINTSLKMLTSTFLGLCIFADFASGNTTESLAPSIREKWKLADYPNPQLDPEACGRGHRSWVCDPSGMLTPKEGM